MSRIGKKPVIVPKGVTVQVGAESLVVQGPKGRLEQKIPTGVRVEQADGRVQIHTVSNDRQSNMNQGLLRSLLANMVTGVEKGFEKVLVINGVGYRAEMSGNNLVLQLGFSHKINLPIPKGIEMKVENNARIVIRGADKHQVGQLAADIRRLRRADPYKAKGITYEGEQIIRKAGKKAVGQG